MKNKVIILPLKLQPKMLLGWQCLYLWFWLQLWQFAKVVLIQIEVKRLMS